MNLKSLTSILIYYNPKWAHKEKRRKNKCKFFPVHAIKAYGGVEAQLDLFLTSELDGSGQLHAPVALPPGNGPLYPLNRRICGP
jgi:hypothetical protein